jgi:hypothetical protein
MTPALPASLVVVLALADASPPESTSRGTPGSADDDVPLDVGGLLRRAGSFETANGFPNGLIEIGAAILLVLLVIPIRRAARFVLSR